MERAGAAKGDQREASRIVAALDRDHAQRPLHADVRHAQHARRRLLEIAAEGADYRPQRTSRRRHGEQYSAAEKAVRPKAAEQQVGVGDGRLVAVAVASRAGVGAGALRPDAQRAASIDAGNRPAARADGVNVDRRDAQRHTVDRRFRR